MRTILKLVIALVLCTPSLLAQKSKPLSDSELAEITARGRMLAEYDNASWHATDAVMALKPENGTVRRYIARKTDAGWVVDFGRFNETKDAFLIVYEATQGSSARQFTVKTYDPPQKDTGFFYIAAKAIEVSVQNFRAEKRPYNTYVLPLASTFCPHRPWRMSTHSVATCGTWYLPTAPQSSKHASSTNQFWRLGIQSQQERNPQVAITRTS